MTEDMLGNAPRLSIARRIIKRGYPAAVNRRHRAPRMRKIVVDAAVVEAVSTANFSAQQKGKSFRWSRKFWCKNRKFYRPDPKSSSMSFSVRTMDPIGAPLHRLDDALGHFLGVAEQHHGVVAIEQRIVDAGIAGGERALDEHHGARFPHLQYRHAVDR